MKTLRIGEREIGPGHPAYLVAEIGFNHEGDVRLGARMIEAAARAGADAVKFQTYLASDLTLESHSHYDLIKHGELDLLSHGELAKVAAENGVHFLSTPFSLNAVDMLEATGVPAYKVASMDVTYHPMLEKIGRLGKPVFLSTGMATLSEIGEAVEILRGCGNDQVVVLHCTSHYPPDPGNANILTIGQLAEAFGLPVGYSDHVLGNAAAIASVALGAVVIEKHFTTDKTLPGPDHKISMDPDELAALVRDVRIVEQAMGRRCADERRPDRAQASEARRGLYAARDIPAGTIVTEDMVKCVRPERGLAPKFMDVIIGRAARVEVKHEAPITFENF